MSRATIVVLTVMWVSSSALAQIPNSFVGVFQTQSQVGTILNSINNDLGGVGSSTVSLGIDNLQSAVGRQFSARQGQQGLLMQVGKISAKNGTLSLAQNLGSEGRQVQVVGGGIGPKFQGQTNTLSGNQGVFKIAGASGSSGSGNALQVGTVRSQQFGQNAAGFMRQSSTIDSLQSSIFTGGPGDIGRTGNTVSIVTEQRQFMR